ncbi:aminopeptidase [Labrys miyagiensis]|uniref:Aminopeptidase n=1 Tax=Labrys miyagiensis TaxID=346912 RepID=A0ABQ6CGM9_9HYPH|nr:P1 family peptidase [Labrys miyagiensis]GLS17995.1 aminopeptidase [Labrys miyagiensis]
MSLDPITHGPSGKARARGLGLPFVSPTGPCNAITDVPGIAVGMSTLIQGQSIRTGVTAVLPRPAADLMEPVWAGFFALNGNGEMTGSHWIEEAGCFAGPVLITNTMSVGMAHHGMVHWLARRFPAELADDFWPLPVVAETYDGYLNDIARLAVTQADVTAALDGAASGPVPEGNAGGGTGMIAYEWKGGTGTASRLVTIGVDVFTVGVLVQANHGRRPWFRIAGVPVGERLPEGAFRTREQGSIIVVIATDAPLLPTQLKRLARRAGLGVGRGGTPASNSSGDIFLAFTTANGQGKLPEPARMSFAAVSNDLLDGLFLAVVEGVEEAVVNAMLAAETMKGRQGRVVEAIDHEALLRAMRG